MIHSNNLDDSSFQSFNNREFNRTIDDACATQQRAMDNTKKLKFVTTNYADLLEGQSTMNFFGMAVKDHLFVPSESIDKDSDLRNGQNGGVLTNCNVRNGFGALPMPTTPSRYQLYHGDVVTEDSMRNFIESNRKTCNPNDTEYFKRYFYLFDDERGVETPDAGKSIEPPTFGPRGGIGTRFISKS